jgi:hypothetical protein
MANPEKRKKKVAEAKDKILDYVDFLRTVFRKIKPVDTTSPIMDDFILKLGNDRETSKATGRAANVQFSAANNGETAP